MDEGVWVFDPNHWPSGAKRVFWPTEGGYEAFWWGPTVGAHSLVVLGTDPQKAAKPTGRCPFWRIWLNNRGP